ncbi:hypothetical protein BDV18DRAFT_106933 [Aspergillus unguis]
MDQAIYISSPSEAGQDDETLPFLEDYNLPALDDEWLASFNADAFRGDALDRPSKRQRVRGLDDAALEQSSFDLLDSLAPNTLHDPQDRTPNPSATDERAQLLLQILEMFPGISHTYVQDLIAHHTASHRLDADLGAINVGFELAIAKDAIYEEILEQASYPKEDSAKSKRKRDESEEDEGWDSDKSDVAKAHGYGHAAAILLGNEFQHIPMSHIKSVLVTKKRLYHTYVELYSDEHFTESPDRRYKGLKGQRSIDSRKIPAFQQILQRELKAAKKHVEKLRNTQRMKQDEEEAEKANEEEHIRTGNLIECQCCYSDVPMNRSIPCEGDELHFFCFSCIRRSADNQIGIMKYTLQCFDVSGCQASFARSELKAVLGPSIMEKLDSLQQEDEIRKAELDGLEDCPFCSYKAVLPPVEEDKEFRCENSSCKVVSCRLCKQKSHIPKTCQENRKDTGLSERHQVEEAMSQALIRRCPKCQVQIIKESGCNKMQCTKCHTLMCYVCQKDITKESYRHFGRGCRQDDAQNRDDQEVKRAEQAAIDKILKENPDITEKQIRVGHQKPQSNRPPPPDPRIAWQARGAQQPQVMRAAARVRRGNVALPHHHHHEAQHGVYHQARPPAPTQVPVQNGMYAPYNDLFQSLGQPAQGFQPVNLGYQRGNLAAQAAAPRIQNAPPQFHNYNNPAAMAAQNYRNVPVIDPNAAFQPAGGIGQLPQNGALQGQDYRAMFYPHYGPF